MLGFGVGYAAYRMLKSVDAHQVEILITLALVMGLSELADWLHMPDRSPSSWPAFWWATRDAGGRCPRRPVSISIPFGNYSMNCSMLSSLS